MFTSDTDKTSTFIYEVTFKPHFPSPIPLTKEVFHESGNAIPAIEACNTEKLMPYTIPYFDLLHNQFFFIQYTP